ncbi:hypothetical protein J31TS4_19440 [Paenibacillus sp. J31TS4]|uniref:hypothetical protein n=1 Tax=Paenibacillus sp. J31TS4 TaxID=2807195 RepID=UPI001B17EBF9|nr:hypothetical protein [Paenibacillus sp. J31TS4]GIP38664.1 hypothetical protein J31TS4_19440 [Paenibacillus sp. J31TS4]
MAFRSLFWGFLFLFDFKINGFDILPDLIGYILFLSGLSRLAERHPLFAKAKPLAVVLLVLSVFKLIPYQLEVGAGFAMSGGVLLVILLGLINTALVLFFVYCLCGGVAALAEEAGQEELARTARFRWNLYLVMAIGVFVATLIPPLGILLVIPLFLYSIVVLALLMGLMQQAERAIG